MSIIIVILQLLNYIFFSILIGHVFLQFVPKENKPTIEFSNNLLIVALLGIVVTGFAPILNVVYFFQGNQSTFALIFSVIEQFPMGKAWILTVFASILMLLANNMKVAKYVQAVLSLLLIFLVGYGSHAASENFWGGMFTHTLHFIAVTLWVGILLQVGWFSKNQTNWKNFLNWFHSFAIGCVVLIFVSGVLLMKYVMNDITDYPSTWIFSYGQMLLLKHLSIVPILIFAYWNGVLSKKSLQNDSFSPKSWLRVESILLLLVFFFTSVMSIQTPPHKVRPLLDDAPFWIDWLVGVNVVNSTKIFFGLQLESYLFLTLSILSTIFIIKSCQKNKFIQGFLFGILLIMSLYLGLMFSMHV